MFDRLKSVEYAKEWALKFNPKYYDFSLLGGDCTNFVSQCLHAGGVPMRYYKYGWYYSSLSNRAPAWTGVNEFWDFAVNNRGIGVKIQETTLNDLELADVIQFYNGERFYHAVIVTDLSNGIKVCSHDSPALDRPLTSYNFKDLRCGKILNSP